MHALIDTHTHLDQLTDIDGALQRARSAGVASIVAVGMNLLSNGKILLLASNHPRCVLPALGIHPWAIEERELTDTYDFLSAHIHQCVAIGEIGLDYSIKKDKALQREVFCTLLRLAAEHNKPVSTHSREAYEDVFRLVKENRIKQAVFHWYSGPLEMVDQIIESGYFISATPAVEFSQRHRAVIERVPLENLLLETDCPVKYNKVESEPATLLVTLREVAKLKNLDPATVAQATTKNATHFFRLGPQ